MLFFLLHFITCQFTVHYSNLVVNFFRGNGMISEWMTNQLKIDQKDKVYQCDQQFTDLARILSYPKYRRHQQLLLLRPA